MRQVDPWGQEHLSKEMPWWKEYLFLIHKNRKSEVVPEIKIKKIDIRNLATINQQKLVI